MLLALVAAYDTGLLGQIFIKILTGKQVVLKYNRRNDVRHKQTVLRKRFDHTLSL